MVPLLRIGSEAPRLKLDGSLSGLGVRTGELQRCDDTYNRSASSTPGLSRSGHPLAARGAAADEQRILGLLKVVSPEPNAFTDRDAKALRLLGGLMGAALGHAAAYEGRQARLEERTRALQESEQRFKQLVDVAQEGIWVADDRGIITYVNQRMADLLGYANGSMLGRPVYDFIEAESRAGAKHTLSRRGARPGTSQDLRFRRRDGTQLWGLVSSSPILGKDGALVGTVGMVTDITERKRAEEQLRRSADRLAMLHDIDQAIVSAQSPAEIGRAALGRMRRMVPCQRCLVALFDFLSREAQMIAGFSAGSQIQPTPVPLADFASSDALRSGSVRYVEDLSTVDDESSVPPPASGRRHAFHALSPAAGRRGGHRRDHDGVGYPRRVYGGAPRHRTGGGCPAGHRHPARSPARGVGAANRRAGAKSGRTQRRAPRGDGGAGDRALLRLPRPARAAAPAPGLLEAADRGVRAGAGAIGGCTTPNECIRPPNSMSSLVDDLVNVSRIGRQDLLRRQVDLTPLVEDVVGQLRSPDRRQGDRLADRGAAHCGVRRGLIKLALTQPALQRRQVHPAPTAGQSSESVRSSPTARSAWPSRTMASGSR